jgi:tetratricopeptide (TPR) repeat protein
MTRRARFRLLVGLVALGCAAVPSMDSATLPPAEGALLRADERYESPRSPERVRLAALNYEAAGRSDQGPDQAAEGLWKAARAYGWLAQVGGEPVTREADAARGIQLARRALTESPYLAEAHYYLAVNLGLFSELRRAMNHLPEMAEAAEQAAELDPQIDHAGPYRLLGSLYGFAPEPPISLGDAEKGLDYLRKAVQTAPDNPENHFRLAELLAAMGQKADAKHHLEQALFLNETDADPTETLAWQTQAKRLWEKIK